MNETSDPQEPDLIDRIANALPAEVRADYYREMRYLRSLPENDEMLRILRAMQFLTALIFDAPLRTATENEKLKEMLVEAFGTIQELIQSMKAQQAQLDQRLTRLPQAVAAGIKPEAIAGSINESLRQLFLQSTIPETASALAVTSAQIKKTNVELIQTARGLSDIHTGDRRGDARSHRQPQIGIFRIEKRSCQLQARLRSRKACVVLCNPDLWTISRPCARVLVSTVLFPVNAADRVRIRGAKPSNQPALDQGARN